MAQRCPPWPLLIALPLLAALAGGATRAQERVPDVKSLVPIDRVVATVNDTVILYSDVLTQSSGDLRVAEAQKGSKLTQQESERIMSRNLEALTERAALAQAAKTLGVIPPDRVEEIFQQMLHEEEREQMRELGSYQKYAQELARQNRTYQTFERDQRMNKLADLTIEMGVYGRLQNQKGLFITPRMMREWYRRNQRTLLGTGALVGIVAFSGTDAASAAEAAAKAWRGEALTSTELAARFEARGAHDLGAVRITEDSRKSLLPQMVEFGLAGPKDAVSDPVAVGQSWQVWRVVDFRGGQQKPFDDPDVQYEIRAQLEQQIRLILTDQTIHRAMDRTERWQPPQLLFR